MNDIFDNSILLFDSETNTDYLGLVQTPSWPINSESYLEIEIDLKNAFRPDKISYQYYNTPNFSWVIDEINNIFSISDYYIGRKIKILKLEFLEQLGIFE